MNRINGNAAPLRSHVPENLRLWTMLFRDGPNGPIVSQVRSSESKPCVLIELPTGLKPEHVGDFLAALFAKGSTVEEAGDDPHATP